jgi:hypothetical protein
LLWALCQFLGQSTHENPPHLGGVNSANPPRTRRILLVLVGWGKLCAECAVPGLCTKDWKYEDYRD